MIKKYKKLKELWNDKIYHSIIMLALFIAFMIFVFVVLALSGNKENRQEVNNVDEFTTYKEMKNYEYTITYNQTKIITGTYYNNVNYFKIDFDSYKYENNILYKNNQVSTDLLEPNVLKFNHTNLYELINKSSLDRTITYSYNEKKKIYNVSNVIFNMWYQTEIPDLSNTIMTLNIDNNKIKKIEFENNKFRLQIEYNHVNEIKGIEENHG